MRYKDLIKIFVKNLLDLRKDKKKSTSPSVLNLSQMRYKDILKDLPKDLLDLSECDKKIF